MIRTVTIYPDEKIAREAAKLEVHLVGGELKLAAPLFSVKKGATRAYFVAQDKIDQLKGLEFRQYYTHYDVLLTEAEKTLLESIKRG